MITKLLTQIMLWVFAIAYGIMMSLVIIKTVVMEGYGKVFNKIKRERPACLQDPSLGTHGYLNLENLKIHYVANGPEDKPLMLFLHGFPDYWYSWRNQLRAFNKDYRCVAIDLRGYGESDKPSGFENYSLTFLMDDIKQVIEALGYKSCVLVSHDMGGAIAWPFARYFPDYVDKLIVMNCPSSVVFRKLLRADKNQFKMSWYMFFFQLPILPEVFIGMKDLEFCDMLFSSLHSGGYLGHPGSCDDVEAHKYTFSQPNALTPPIDYYRAMLRLKPTKYDMNYTMPVLLIWGMKDVALSQKLPEMIEKEAPQIQVKRIENAGHFVQFDTPDEVNEIMREWLSSQQQT